MVMSMNTTSSRAFGYLPDESPSLGKLIVFAFQQILVMFPATVLVAILTGFDIGVTIFASGLATLGFLFITRGKIPLYYGSSFAYIAAITGLIAAQTAKGVSGLDAIRMAQFGIVMSGLVSIAAGLVASRFGVEAIEKVLPPTVTGSIALTIGMSLAAVALSNASGSGGGDFLSVAASRDPAAVASWIIAILTLIATIMFSIHLKKTAGQLPLLFGVIFGYALAAIVTVASNIKLIDFAAIAGAAVIQVPKFSLPLPGWAAVAAIMPIAIATIPESTAHLFQLDIYVNELARSKGSAKKYDIGSRLGSNLIGDGIGDIISGMIGGPAGTNYGENISTMAITRNFSVRMLGAASIITMLLAFSGTLSQLVYSIPACVIGGISIYLFGVIGAQGIAIMINKKVDMFDTKNLAVISTILVIGIGGSFINGGMIPVFGLEIPAIATASIFGILLNLLLSVGKKKEV